jgi:hypothetical protein
MWYVIGAVLIALPVAIVWSHGRKSARRKTERERRFRDMLSEARLVTTATAQAAMTPAAPAPSVVPPLATVPVPGAVPEAPAQILARKSRLLGQPDALLYYVLRTGLPDHEVFACLTLADIVDLAPGQGGYDAVQRLRRLAQQRVDFVVCSRSLEIVAVVMVDRLGPADAAQIEGRRIVEESLWAAGVRLVRIDPAAPPRHQQVRALVYGGKPGAD